MGISADGMAITPHLHSWAYGQESKEGKCGYIAFFKGKQTEVWAETSLKARDLAAHYFRTKKPHEVSVILCQRADGSQVIHSGAEL